jgi:phenylacetate-coenzyme A ligase PaaK-like adenylate-forming protein
LDARALFNKDDVSMPKQTAARNWTYSPEYFRDSAQTLETALAHVRAYRSWKAFDPGPDYPADIRYAALPALTKKDIRENFPLGLIPDGRDIGLGLASGEIQLVSTSGTTDDQVTNIWNQKWWDASERASWKLNSVMDKIASGVHREAILVNPKNVGFASDEADLPMEKRRMARFLYLNEKTDPLAWSNLLMDRMIQELEAFRPEVLEANPSYLARLCRYITATGRTAFQPGAIVFTYEFPVRFHYQQIRQVFARVPLISSYGTTETGYVFMQCEEGKLHQNSEFCRVDFEPLKPEHGGPLLGRILVTPFNNPWTYLVRFDTEDVVRLEESRTCPCGRNSGLILSSIAGRRVNLTLTCSGRLVTLLELDDVMSRLAGLEMYKLVQPGPGAYELHLVSRRSDTKKLNAEAVSLFKNLYGPDARITVIHEADIGPETSGKYLVSQANFPIDFERCLDRRAVAENGQNG